MSRSIDERIVQMTFENGDFEKNAKTTMGTLEKLKESLNFDSAIDGFKRLGESTSVFDRLKDSINFDSAIGNITNLANAALQLSGIKTGFDLSDASKSLAAFTGDVESTRFDTLLSNIDEITDRFSAFGIAGAEVIRKITDGVIELGNKMVHSLVLDQVETGFAKYEQSTKDIIAIMNQADASEETVNKYIETLSWYSDATSFDVNSMTSALKMFASQGIELQNAIPVIMGIGNSVTYAGAAAKEGSSAFDAYSKAIAAGYLGNREWITLSRGLGVATIGLKKQFMESAIALGTLKEQADGTLTTAEGLTVTVENFQSTLGDQKGKWLTTDVIMDVFGKQYGGYTERLAAFTQKYQALNDEVISFTDSTKLMAMAEDELISIAGSKTVDEALDNVIDTFGSDYAERLKIFSDQYTEQEGKVLSLEEAMEKLAGGTRELGLKYLLSATQARTFTEAVDAVKDAASTVWKSIFTDIFGTTTEAIELWTRFSDGLFDVFVTPLANVRLLTKGWKDLGGRTMMIDSLARSFDVLKKAVAPVKEAFTNIFPPATADTLMRLTQSFANLTYRANSFFSTQLNTEGLRKSFEGLFAVIDIGRLGFKSLFDAISPVGEIFTTLLNKTLGLTGSLGDYIVNLRNSIAEHNSFGDALKGVKTGLENFGEALKSAFSGKAIVNAGILGKILDGLRVIFSKIKEIGIPTLGLIKDGISAVWDTLVSGIKNTSIEDLFNLLKGGIFTNIALNLSTFSRKLKEGFGLWDAISDIRWTFEVLGASIKAFCMSIEANLLLKIAGALAILTISLSALSAIPSDDLGRALGGMASMMTGLTIMFKSITANTSFFKLFGDVGNGILKLSGGILVLALAVKLLSNTSWTNLVDGLAALAAVGAGLLIFLKYANFKTIGVKAGIGMIGLATGIAILAASVKSLTNMNVDNIGTALMAFSGILLGVGLAVNNMPKNMLSIGAGMMMVSVGIGAIALSLKLLGTMTMEQVGTALTAIAGSLMVLTAAVNGAKTALVGAAAILVITGALALLVPTLIALGHASPTTIGMALIYLAGAFVVFGAAAAAFDAFGLSAALAKLGGAMLVLGAATVVLAAGIAILANLPLTGIFGSLIAIAGALAIFGVAATVLAPLAVPMLAIAGVLAVIGAASAIFGAGVLVISAGISALAAALSLIGPLTGVFFIVAGGLAVFGLGSLVAAGGIAVLAVALNAFAGAALLLAPTIPIILKLAGAIAVLSIAVIAIIAAIKYLAGNLTLGDDIAAIGEKVKSGFNSMVTSIELFFLNVVKSMLKDIPIFGDKIADSIDKKIKKIEEEDMSKKRAEAMAENYSAGIVKGMDSKAEAIYLEGQELAEKGESGIKSKGSSWFDSAASLVSKFVSGLNSKQSSITAASRKLAQQAEKAMKYELGIQSPSKEFEEIGEMSDAGYAEGIEEGTPEVLDSIKSMASGALSTLSETMGENLEIPALDASNFTSSLPDSLSNLVDGNIDLSDVDGWDASPTITPVLDLTEIQNGASGIDSILNGQTISASMNGLTTTNTQHELNIEADLSAIRDDISRLYGIHEVYVNKADTRVKHITQGFGDTIEGMSVYLDSAKVGRIVDIYQSNVKRASGV